MQAFEKTKDKVAIVGFSSTTRDLAPYNNDEYEIWGMNEEYNFPWFTKYDRMFQMHPRWNFSTVDNPNDPNHFHWLRGKDGVCIRCKGTKKFIPMTGAKVMECTACDEKGMYHVDPRRAGKIIYMQKKHKDIPGSAKYPLKEISEKFNIQMPYNYFTSTCTFALAMAMHMGFKRIEFYGIEMANNTEYSYQRANMEYWVGLGRGLGFDIYSSATQGLLRGSLYGYENMKIGYRQDLEARKQTMENQIAVAETNLQRYTGKLAAVKEIIKEHPEFAEALKEKADTTEQAYHKYIGEKNFVAGAAREVQNLTELYDIHYANQEIKGEADEQEEN